MHYNIYGSNEAYSMQFHVMPVRMFRSTVHTEETNLSTFTVVNSVHPEQSRFFLNGGLFGTIYL
jgi:hypothetical protein